MLESGRIRRLERLARPIEMALKSDRCRAEFVQDHL